MTKAKTPKKPAWWISWYHPAELGGFELHWPWWSSGWSFDKDGNEINIFVAAVRADSEDEAFDLIESSYDEKPEKGLERRFCDKLEEDESKPWEHAGGRFQLGDWMSWE